VWRELIVRVAELAGENPVTAAVIQSTAVTAWARRAGPWAAALAPGQHREHARRSDPTTLAGDGERGKDRAGEHHAEDERAPTFHPASIADRSSGRIPRTGTAPDK